MSERIDDIQVANSAVRCPYCHDSVSPDEEAWVACRECLARHHPECWNEPLRCSTCGGGTALVTEVTTLAGRAESPVDKRRRLLRVHFKWSLLVLLSLLANLALLILIFKHTTFPSMSSFIHSIF